MVYGVSPFRLAFILVLHSHLCWAFPPSVQMRTILCQVKSTDPSVAASRVFLLAAGSFSYNFLRNCDGYPNCAAKTCLTPSSSDCGVCPPSYFVITGTSDPSDPVADSAFTYVRVYYPVGTPSNIQVTRGTDVCTVKPTEMANTAVFNWTSSGSFSACGVPPCSQHQACDYCLQQTGCGWCRSSSKVPLFLTPFFLLLSASSFFLSSCIFLCLSSPSSLRLSFSFSVRAAPHLCVCVCA